MTSDELKKTALNACQAVENYSGSMAGIPYAKFRGMMDRIHDMNAQIASGGLVVLSAAEHKELLANQKVKRGKK